MKDILKDILNCTIVVPDLTDRNPNVFYELGVRHSLRNKTIILAQNRSDIPFDLQSYANHKYRWKTKKDLDSFKKRMKSLVNYIEAHPDRPDNPVGDFLGTKEGIEDTIGSISTFIDRFQNQMNIYKKESDMLKSDIEELKNVVSTIPAPKKDLQLRHRFEGVWYSEETDNTLVIKVVNNKIRGCYNYGHNKLIGHYRNTAIVGGILRYEFEWIDKSYAGKGFEKLSKDGKKMSGGWWFSYMNLKYDIAEKHYESVTTPEDLIITKSEFKRRRRKTPKWAEVYFKNIQKSPSYYD